MNTRIALLTSACALALSACGDKSPPLAAPTATPPIAETTSPTAETTPPAGEAAPTSTSTAPEAGSKVAVVTGCGTEIESNDAMQFNVNSIAVPASCAEFKITLKHVGKMPVAAMGHNVVITTTAGMQQALTDGMAAGLPGGYVKPGDEAVIAHTNMIGGGETTSVSFAVSKIQGGGPYTFFCSFPGHAALMKGTITVE